MERLTVTLDEENAEYIEEQSGDEGDFESEVVNEAVRRMSECDEEPANDGDQPSRSASSSTMGGVP